MIIPAGTLAGPLFVCGHPRTDANTDVHGGRCAFCLRMRHKRMVVDAVLERWRRGPRTVGEKINAGLL